MLGFRELAQTMKKYGAAGSEILDKALRAAAHVVRDEMERQAPIGDGRVHYPQATSSTGGKFAILRKARRSGYLKKNIIIAEQDPKNMGESAASFLVGPASGAFYGYFLQVRHYGREGKNRFMTRAYDVSESRAMAAAADAASKELEKVK